MLFVMMFAIVGIANASVPIWITNNTITNGYGLGSGKFFGNNYIVYNFSGNNLWTAISGDLNGVWYGFTWDGSVWSQNSSLVNGLFDVGSYSSPYLVYNFSNNGMWTLFSGGDYISAFVWNGSIWNQNTSLVDGISDTGSRYNALVTFNLVNNTKWNLIATNNNGIFYGYSWNGTSWISNSTIITGLSNYPTVYGSKVEIKYNVFEDNRWYFTAGLSGQGGGLGANAYYWNGTSWILDSNKLLNGISGGYVILPVLIYGFNGDDKWQLFSAVGTGLIANELTPDSPNYYNINTTEIDTGNFFSKNLSISVYWNTTLNLSNYIFSTNITGSWVNSTEVTFTGQGNWSNITKNITSIGNKFEYYWRIYTNNSVDRWNDTGEQYHSFYGIDYTNVSELFETGTQIFDFNFDGFNPINPTQFSFYSNKDFIYNNNTSAVWYLNEGTGTQTNDSKDGFNSIAMVNTSWTTGQFGNATQFNGSNSYVTFGNVLGFERTDPFSMSIWVKRNDTGIQQTFIGKRDSTARGYSIFVQASNVISFALTNTVGTNFARISTVNTFTNTSKWYNIITTYDGSSSVNGLKLYIDGILQNVTLDSNTLTSTISNTGHFNLGSFNNGTQNFNGSVDHVAVWNGTVLSQTDVTRIYNYTSLDSYPNYLNRTWYNMTEGLLGQYSISKLIPEVSSDTNAIYGYRWSDTIAERNIFIPTTIKNFQIGLNGSVSILNVTFYDELNQTDISPNMTTTSIWKVTFPTGAVQTFSLNTTGAFTINMTPSTAVVQADVEFIYIKNGYRQRTYYLTNATLSGASVTQLRLADIVANDTISSLITFTLKNYNTDILPNYYIDIQRWYVDQNGYSTIAIAKTDVTAKAVIWLQPYLAFYRILVYDGNGNIVYTASRQVISQSDIEIQLQDSMDSNTYEKYSSILYTFTKNKTTGLVRADLTDTTGSTFSAVMNVNRLGLFGSTTVCNATGDGSATSLICSAPLNTSDEYVITVDVTKGGTTFPLISDSLNYKSGEYGLDGIVSAFLIIGTLAFMGLGSPHMAILTTLLGIGISVALGLLVTGVASFVGLIIVGIAMLMVMRR